MAKVSTAIQPAKENNQVDTSGVANTQVKLEETKNDNPNVTQNGASDREKSLRDEVNWLAELDKERKRHEDYLTKQVRFRNFIIILLLIIIIILAIIILFKDCNCKCNCNGKGTIQTTVVPVKEQEESTPIESSEPTPESSSVDLSNAYVTMPVVTDFTNDVIIYCPNENKDLFEISYKFTNKDTDEVIYQSDYLAAGQQKSVNFKQLLEKGTYSVRVSIASRFVDTGKQANGTGSDITITVK